LIYLDNNQNIYSIFNITAFNQLNNAVFNISPSMCEYYINDLLQSLNTNTVFNKSNIQDSVNLDSYTIYLDYDENIYIEENSSENEYETQSLW